MRRRWRMSLFFFFFFFIKEKKVGGKFVCFDENSISSSFFSFSCGVSIFSSFSVFLPFLILFSLASSAVNLNRLRQPQPQQQLLLLLPYHTKISSFFSSPISNFRYYNPPSSFPLLFSSSPPSSFSSFSRHHQQIKFGRNFYRGHYTREKRNNNINNYNKNCHVSTSYDVQTICSLSSSSSYTSLYYYSSHLTPPQSFSFSSSSAYFVSSTTRNCLSLFSSSSSLLPSSSSASSSSSSIALPNFGVILVAGGIGSRMKSKIPKQYFHLLGREVIQYSIDIFRSFPSASVIVIVADDIYHPKLRQFAENDSRVHFASSGVERHESVWNGLQLMFNITSSSSSSSSSLSSSSSSFSSPKYSSTTQNISIPSGNTKITSTTTLHAAGQSPKNEDEVLNASSSSSSSSFVVAIHDAARPCVSTEAVERVVREGREFGAAVLGVSVKSTIKESGDDGQFVKQTLNRSRLWEIQTPQVIDYNLLYKGYEEVRKRKIMVTDDASAIELLNQTVKITRGEFTNIKITTPEDIILATTILQERKRSEGRR